MTDKEKKSKIADILMDFQEEYSNEVVNRPMLASLYAGNILSFIDSLQEESIGKVWHYQKEEPIDEITDKSRPIVVIYGYNSLNAAGKFRCYEDNSKAIWLSNAYEKWAFIEDLIDLSQSVKTSDQEEPAPKILEDMFNAKTAAESLGISAEEHDKIIDLCIYGEEPVSEKLEEACEQLAEKARKHKAETSSPFFNPTDYKQGVIDGAKCQKEQMIKSAVDAECDVILLEEGDELQYSVLYPKGKKPFNKGDKVKLIIVKED